MTWFTNYILNTIIVLILLLLGNFVYVQGTEAYIRHADISNFYENKDFFVENICVGDTKQAVASTRFVYGTDTGYDATVIRELFLVERGLQTKILDEAATPFIEVAENGSVTRIQNIPSDLEVGAYQWVLRISLVIKGIIRDDIPLVESNVFQIKNCS